MLRPYYNSCRNIFKAIFIILKEIICYVNWEIFYEYETMGEKYKRKTMSFWL